MSDDKGFSRLQKISRLRNVLIAVLICCAVTIAILCALKMRCFHFEEFFGSLIIYGIFVSWLPYVILSLSFKVAPTKVDTAQDGVYTYTTTHYASIADKEADQMLYVVSMLVIAVAICLFKIVNVQPLMFLMEEVRCSKCPY